MNSCLFCRIARKEIPAKVALETDQVLAFHDIGPQAPTHILVIPKTHIESVAALTDEHKALVGELMLAAQRVARDAGIDAAGYRVVANTGAHGGQSVFHLHLHVLGGRPLGWPPG